MTDDDEPRITWRYVFARETHGEEEVWTVRELYTDADGKISWSADPMRPQGDTWLELAEDLIRMQTGFGMKEVLDLDLDPPALVPVKGLGRLS